MSSSLLRYSSYLYSTDRIGSASVFSTWKECLHRELIKQMSFVAKVCSPPRDSKRSNSPCFLFWLSIPVTDLVAESWSSELCQSITAWQQLSSSLHTSKTTVKHPKDKCYRMDVGLRASLRFSDLPEDVCRLVFEFAAELDEQSGRACALVSRKVNTW